MHRILEKEKLAPEVYRLRVEAPLIAEARRPGQFVIVQPDTDFGERIPLTIADAGKDWITLIFQTVGKTTHLLADMQVGDSIENVLGPLGKPTEIAKYGHVVCVGGGIGVAPLLPIAEAMQQAGNRLTVIIGARTAELVILEDRLRKIADRLVVCTDDGSHGRRDLVTAPLEECCAGGDKPDLAVAIGPPVMMKFCAETTRPYGIRTMVSLNTIMIDGTGMCGGCRVTVGGKTRFVCVDGPEFDGHEVDFDNMMQRLGSYRRQEDRAHEQCHLDEQARALSAGRQAK